MMGSMEHPLSSLSIEGSVKSDGGSCKGVRKRTDSNSLYTGVGGGSGGTVLLFLTTLTIGQNATLSSSGGKGGPDGGGGGGGGRVHFHWSNIPTGDLYQPIATVEGNIFTGLDILFVNALSVCVLFKSRKTVGFCNHVHFYGFRLKSSSQ